MDDVRVWWGHEGEEFCESVPKVRMVVSISMVARIETWSPLGNDVEQSVPSMIGGYEVDQVWLQTVVERVHWYVQDEAERER